MLQERLEREQTERVEEKKRGDQKTALKNFALSLQKAAHEAERRVAAAAALSAVAAAGAAAAAAVAVFQSCSSFCLVAISPTKRSVSRVALTRGIATRMCSTAACTKASLGGN